MLYEKSKKIDEFQEGSFKNVKKIFLFCPLSGGRKALGGVQSTTSFGFCSKWVRISSNKHHPRRLAGCSAPAAPLL
jgi:hypothetical protein